MDTPSNLMTPTIFGQVCISTLECGFGLPVVIPRLMALTLWCWQCATEALSALGVQVKIHDKAWAQQQGMGAFLGVAQGSNEPPVFIEAVYRKGPTNQKPIILVGKERIPARQRDAYYTSKYSGCLATFNYSKTRKKVLQGLPMKTQKMKKALVNVRNFEISKGGYFICPF